jgi:hypothetical protein
MFLRNACSLALVALAVAACDKSAVAGRANVADAAIGDGGADAADARAGWALDAAADDDTVIPPTSSDELTGRAKHLLESIVEGNADLAQDIVFPRDAYISTHEGLDAAARWEKKVSAAFKKQIARLHKKKAMDRAQFVALELGHSVTQSTPGHHDWKRALWRVRGSRLAYVVDGKPYTISISEMVAWHGAWYVTKIR